MGRRLVRRRQGDGSDAAPEALGRLELAAPEIPADCDPATAEIVRTVAPYTLTPAARVIALCDAIRHLERRGIPGAIVECGVWRGGSMLAAALCLLELGTTERELCLYDTFGEVPAPGDRDVHVSGTTAADWMSAARAEDPSLGQVGVEGVRRLLVDSGYPAGRVRLEAGLVEETIPARAPERIALCRLDTDWYGSTRHELEHLYPRISPGGVLIIDDYGEFAGSREATDEYLSALPDPPLLLRIDAAARITEVGV